MAGVFRGLYDLPMPTTTVAITDSHAPIEGILLLLRRDPHCVQLLRQLDALVDPERVDDYLRRLWQRGNLTRLFMVHDGLASPQAMLLQRLEARLARWVPEEAERRRAVLYVAVGDKKIEPVDNACLPGAKMILDGGVAVLEADDGAWQWPITAIGVPATPASPAIVSLPTSPASSPVIALVTPAPAVARRGRGKRGKGYTIHPDDQDELRKYQLAKHKDWRANPALSRPTWQEYSKLLRSLWQNRNPTAITVPDLQTFKRRVQDILGSH